MAPAGLLQEDQLRIVQEGMDILFDAWLLAECKTALGLGRCGCLVLAVYGLTWRALWLWSLDANSSAAEAENSRLLLAYPLSPLSAVLCTFANDPALCTCASARLLAARVCLACPHLLSTNTPYFLIPCR